LDLTPGTAMANFVLLNNITHKDLKINAKPSPLFGDNIGSTLTFPTEFGDVQREYPILFRKDPDTGEFQSIVIFGFESKENLFLDERGWNAKYIPAIIARGPFVIGFQTQNTNGVERKEPVIHVDMDSPRLSSTEGEPAFLPQGGNSPYIERISRILMAIFDGVTASKAMFAAFTELDLMEPIRLEIEFNNGVKHIMQSYYTVNEEKLRNLSGEHLAQLNSMGLLQAAYLVIASLNNVRDLVEMKNRRL
jgi:hypothetical protein